MYTFYDNLIAGSDNINKFCLEIHTVKKAARPRARLTLFVENGLLR